MIYVFIVNACKSRPFALGSGPNVIVLVIISVVFLPGIRIFVEAAVVLCAQHKCVEVIHLADHVRMFLVI